MTQKLFCMCAAVALLFALATANVANAQEAAVAPAGCPCVFATAPCQFVCPARVCTVRAWHPWQVNPCPPMVSYRVGPFGAIRPVMYAPVYRPVHVRPVHVVPRVHVHRWHTPGFVW